MLKDKRELEEKELLISELLIANHNMVSVLNKMHDMKESSNEMLELYKMFEKEYNEVLAEIYRRLDFYERCRK